MLYIGEQSFKYHLKYILNATGCESRSQDRLLDKDQVIKWECPACCLMGNHCDLLIETISPEELLFAAQAIGKRR
jgi:hypothetical protein